MKGLMHYLNIGYFESYKFNNIHFVMIKSSFILLIISCLYSCVYDQKSNETMQKEVKKYENNLKSSQLDTITFDSNDALLGYYIAAAPIDKDVIGAIVLLPGLGQKPENVYRDTKIPEYATASGLVTIAYAGQMRITADTIVRQRLSQVITDAISRYNIPVESFAIGGFSAGGVVALRYSELCYEFPSQYPIQPKAIFMADAPVDLYTAWQRSDELRSAGNSQVSIDETNWLEKLYNNLYGGTPAMNPDRYRDLSPFSIDTAMGQHEVHLSEVAVRAYHDVDIPWRLKNRNQSVYHENFLMTSELINRLLLLGNDKAEFVQTHNTGYRADGTRHPHSWSIIDAEDCVDWILREFEEQ